MAARRRPRLGSLLALRVAATAITLVSFGGMTAFVAQHPKPIAAALAPAVVGAAVPVATPAPTGRLRLSPQVPVTRLPPVTSTHRS